MGMLLHHTWLEQQKQEAKKPAVREEKPVVKEEPAEEPVKRGRRKTTK